MSFILLLSGCGDDGVLTDEDLKNQAGGTLKETVAVSGKVTIDGKPGNRVQIFAFSKEGGMKPASECLTSSDGTYCWSTYKDCDGLPPGEYRFAFKQVGAREKPGAADKLKGKFMNPVKNEFALTAESGKPQTDVNYDLKLK